jgi:foldase protein PrsA
LIDLARSSQIHRLKAVRIATIPSLTMKTMRSIMALGAFFVLSVVVAGCGSGIPGNSVADVAGNPITVQAFNHWMYVAAKGQSSQTPGQPVIVPTDPPNFTKCIANIRAAYPAVASQTNKQLKNDCQQLFSSLSNQVMGFLIQAYWYQADAAKEHIKVSDAQVQQTLNTERAQQFPTEAGFQSFLTQTGQTLQDILYRVRLQELFAKLVSKKSSATITQAQIQSYYNSHLGQFGTPDTRNIRIVLTKTLAQANAAKAALASGKNWDVVAKQYSTDPATKNSGGLLVGVTKGQQDQALNNAAFAPTATLNKLIGPVQGQYGYYVVEVTKITNGTQQSLAQATPLIRQSLTAKQQTNAQAAVESAAKQHWLHQTLCRTPYAVIQCNGYKAPAASTTTPAAPTGTG